MAVIGPPALLAEEPRPPRGFVPLPDDAEAWKRLPAAEKGSGKPLPAWARALARTLPHTTAAVLELDYLHRARNPLGPKLSAQARWAAAHADGSAHGQAVAAGDFLRAGGTRDEFRALAGDLSGLPEAERAALLLARKLTRSPHAVTDAEVARLVKLHGERQAVALVLLVAHANFQDRLVSALGLPAEDRGPPQEFRFKRPPLGTRIALPRGKPAAPAPPAAKAEPDREWLSLDVAALDREIARQRSLRPRITVPGGEGKVIHWGEVCRTHQPELAAGWSACARLFGAEADQDPVFEASVFWVVTRAQRSFY